MVGGEEAFYLKALIRIGGLKPHQARDEADKGSKAPVQANDSTQENLADRT